MLRILHKSCFQMLKYCVYCTKFHPNLRDIAYIVRFLHGSTETLCILFGFPPMFIHIAEVLRILCDFLSELPEHCVYYAILYLRSRSIAYIVRLFIKNAKKIAYIAKKSIPDAEALCISRKSVSQMPKHCVYYEKFDPRCRNVAYITKNLIQDAKTLRMLRKTRSKMPKYSGNGGLPVAPEVSNQNF